MKQIPEEILTKALELLEKGETPERIFASFPAEAEELKTYLRLAASLRSEAEKIEPPSREVLRGALRRAAAMDRAPEISMRPSAAGFFNRIPFGLRAMAPVLAILVLVALAGNSQAPAPELPATEQNLAADSGVATFMAAPEAPGSGQPPAPAATMMAAKSAGISSEADTPSSEADRIAQSYIANAENEDAVLSDTSAEDQAAQADESQSPQYVSEPIN